MTIQKNKKMVCKTARFLTGFIVYLYITVLYVPEKVLSLSYCYACIFK